MTSGENRAAIRVLHITEAMGAGVMTLLESISHRQAAEGAQVEVMYVERPETPPEGELLSRFDRSVKVSRVGGGSAAQRYQALLRAVHAAYRAGEYDVIHLHSSVAGAIGRFIALGRRSTPDTFYSPHGFAFLRLNSSRMSRWIAHAVERLLGRVGSGLILTSDSEMELARESLRAPRTWLLQTGVPSTSVGRKVRDDASAKRVLVAMVGRVAYQKAPWRFAHVARELGGEDADFIWIGGGDAEDVDRWLDVANLRVTGWVSTSELDALFDAVDILVFPTLWEGMSLSLIQAQAKGIPAVVSDVVGNRDCVRDGATGFVCGSDSELVERTRVLIQDAAVRHQMSDKALTWASTALTDDAIGIDSLKIYRVGSRSTRRRRSTP